MATMPRRRGAAVHPAVAPLSLVLVLPAAGFFAAAALRLLQPVQHMPAAAADVYLHVFARMPRDAKLGVLVAAPALSLVLAVVDQRLRWRRDAAWRSAVLGLAAACRPVIVRPFAVMSALALLAAAVWFAFILMHAIAG
jgi:hypothetical protein